MRYGGQVQAAIDLYNEIGRKASPADKCMATYFRNHRYIGSKDKGIISGIIYGMMRRMAEVDYLIESQKGDKSYRLRVLVYLLLDGGSKQTITNICSGDTYAPKPLNKEETRVIKGIDFGALKNAPEYVKLNFPKWLRYSLTQSFGDKLFNVMTAMNEQATTDIRVNTLKTTREALKESLRVDGVHMEETKYSPLGLRMEDRKSVFSTKAFNNGEFEMQDEGSQLIAAFTGVEPGMKVVDFCAGAGGKTLALAAKMNNKGTIHACDVNERRLGEMGKRLKRAGVNNVREKLLVTENDKWVKRNKETQDVVLIDAPCSGSGTWRRSPDSRWKLTQESLAELNEIQARVLQSASRMAKVGGRVVYATCSVLGEENEQQVEAFLKENENFKLVPAKDIDVDIEMPAGVGDYVQLNPYDHGTDGFFIAVLERLS